MKTIKILHDNGFIKLMMLFFTLLVGCNQIFKPMSEQVTDKHAGMNGGFEYTKSGLPVNWLMYTPKTVPDGDFDIEIDTIDFVEGKQSLKFIVRACSADGGWHSPGFCNEFPAEPGQKFMIGFWVKNKETHFLIRIGGIGLSFGQYEPIVNTDETIDTWRKFEYNYTIPEKMSAIRMEVNILKPGIFWIDGISISKD